MNSSVVRPPEAAAPAPITAMLRTVLLCDLVESTALVERLGDGRAAQLLQRHDQLLQSLLAASGGQLIDKADGVLALFERPVQALQFALGYQRGLRVLGHEVGETLSARVGIHVGDVMTWTHSPAEVLAGAKPVEVEGLAKPVAARLMGLALPGQILLSGMAQNLAHRAQAELGESAAHLRWRLHGRYRFKGVPAPMLVHEAGESGLAPLKAPPSGDKAWRELPLWRKPPVLAVEAMLLLGLVSAGVWTTLRSPPAIAFNERDWVVVADFNNLTGETLYDEALDSALRVGLEQSRYVNVLSDLQVDQALQRMQRAGQPLDRQTGAELALREGAKALVLPTVAEVGGRPRVSVEVIDPNSGVTVYTHMADAAGDGGVLAALDEVLGDMRGDLGESLASVEKSSKPLAKVTTGNLEALRAFALGQSAYYSGDHATAERHFRQALELDVEFAMALAGLSRIHYARREVSTAYGLANQALALGERLTSREKLFLEATAAQAAGVKGIAERWKALLDLYPDHHFAAYSCANARLVENRFEQVGECLDAALAVGSVTRPAALRHKGIVLLGLGDPSGALESFDSAKALGLQGTSMFEPLALAADGRIDAALAMLAADDGRQLEDARGSAIDQAAMLLDKGEVYRGQVVCGAEDLAADADINAQCVAFAGLDALLGRQAKVDERSQRMIDVGLRDVATYESRTQEGIVIAILYAAMRQSSSSGRDGLLSTLAPYIGAAPTTVAKQLGELVAVDSLMQAGDANAAVRRLEPLLDGSELLLTRARLADAYSRSGRHGEASAQLDWLRQHRGRAYAEWSGYLTLRIENIVLMKTLDLLSAEIALRSGERNAARQYLEAFRSTWPVTIQSGGLQARIQAVEDSLSVISR